MRPCKLRESSAARFPADMNEFNEAAPNSQHISSLSRHLPLLARSSTGKRNGQIGPPPFRKQESFLCNCVEGPTQKLGKHCSLTKGSKILHTLRPFGLQWPYEAQHAGIKRSMSFFWRGSRRDFQICSYVFISGHPEIPIFQFFTFNHFLQKYIDLMLPLGLRKT